MDFTYDQTMEWANSPEAENPFTSDYLVLYFTLFVIILIVVMWYFVVWMGSKKKTEKSIIDAMNKGKNTIDAYDESGSGSDSSAESDVDSPRTRSTKTPKESPKPSRIVRPPLPKSARDKTSS